MKRFSFLLAVAMFIGCSDSLTPPSDLPEDEEKIEYSEASVSFQFTLATDNGNPMSKASNEDVFDEFYVKMQSGELVAESYDLTLTEVSTGERYEFKGRWDGSDKLTLRTGTYHVEGTSKASGEFVQEKCSIRFDEEIEVTASTSKIVLNARYSSFLVIFNSKEIATVDNYYNGVDSVPLYRMGDYWYAFVNSKLFAEDKKDVAYFGGAYDDGVEFKCYLGNINFVKGKYYVYNTVTGGFSLPKMQDGNEDDGGVICLSSSETANCYIAHTNGKYLFNAMVKGNSTLSVGMPAVACVIWETLNTADEPVSGDVVKNVSLNRGNIVFETTDKSGNALIAVKDSDGVILWSWHIWVTNYNPSTEYDVYRGYEGLKVMDRNLGAISDEPGNSSVGLVYQWGRKEPFMGPCFSSAFASTSLTEMVETSISVGTDDYAIQNPTHYIIANYQGGDWRYVSDNSAWDSDKTLLDPCPAGWRIPEGGEGGLWKNFDITNSSSWIFDYDDDGMMFGDEFAMSDIWMPAQGYISDSDTYFTGWWRVGSEGRYWTVTVLGEEYAEYFGFNSDSTTIYHAEYLWSTHCSRANGHAVRCVEDK